MAESHSEVDTTTLHGLVCPNSNIQQFKGHHQNFQLVLRRSNNDLYDYKDDHYIDDGKGELIFHKRSDYNY